MRLLLPAASQRQQFEQAELQWLRVTNAQQAQPWRLFDNAPVLAVPPHVHPEPQNAWALFAAAAVQPAQPALHQEPSLLQGIFANVPLVAAPPQVQPEPQNAWAQFYGAAAQPTQPAWQPGAPLLRGLLANAPVETAAAGVCSQSDTHQDLCLATEPQVAALPAVPQDRTSSASKSESDCFTALTLGGMCTPVSAAPNVVERAQQAVLMPAAHPDSDKTAEQEAPTSTERGECWEASGECCLLPLQQFTYSNART